MFDLDSEQELTFHEAAPFHLKLFLGAGIARGMLRWGDLMRMAALLSVPLNPVAKEKADMNPLLASWMLMQFSDWPASRYRTGLRDGYVYEMQQQAHLLSTYFSYDEQSMILLRLTRAAKSLN